jgi:hypothetical protein
MPATTPQAAEVIQAPPPEFGASPAPDWVIEWLLSVLPNGGRYRGRLLLGGPTPPVYARIEYPISRFRPPVVTEVPLTEEAVGLLREILGTYFPDSLEKLPWLSCDGIPLEIVVHRRHPYEAIRTFCNISDAMQFLSLTGKTLVERWRIGAQSGEQAPPVVPLACFLVDLSTRIGG